MRKLAFVTIAAWSLACTSCSNGLYPVSGKVIYNGAPAVGAAVHFLRQGADPLNEPAIMGLVSDDGSFTLECGTRGKGAPPGEYDVLITWRRAVTPNKGQAEKAPDWFRGRYADPKHPLFHATLKAETNILPQFELTD